MIRESDIEKYLRFRVEELDGHCFKWVSPSNRGVPDRIVMLPGGGIWFVELKSPGEDLSPLQKFFKERLQYLGQTVIKIDSMEGVDEFVGRISAPWISADRD